MMVKAFINVIIYKMKYCKSERVENDYGKHFLVKEFLVKTKMDHIRKMSIQISLLF